MTVSSTGEGAVVVVCGMWLSEEEDTEEVVSIKVMVYRFCAPWRRGCHSSGLESSVVLR